MSLPFIGYTYKRIAAFRGSSTGWEVEGGELPFREVREMVNGCEASIT